MIKNFEQGKKKIEIIFLILLSVILTGFAFYQQIFLDKLPATGDLIHRRIVYILTNFPNFPDAPTLVLSHSQFYHTIISYFNIFTGLTGEKAFYGMSLMNLFMLPLTIFILYITTYRFSKKNAFLAPLFFVSNPLLLFPFFGSADQHLIYIFFTLFLFVTFFLPSTLGTKMLVMLFLGMTFISSFIIWILLFFVILFIEFKYPQEKIFLTLVVSLIFFLPWLNKPLGYFLLSDYSGNSLWKIFALITGTIPFILMYYWFTKKNPKIRSVILLVAVFLSTIFFIIPRTGKTTFAFNIRPEEMDSIKSAFLATANVVNTIFSANPAKNIVGQEIIIALTLLLLTFIGILWYLKKTPLKFDLKTRGLLLIITLPFFITLLRLFLLKISFETFSKTPLFNLHHGRINSIALFLISIIFAREFSSLWSIVGLRKVLLVCMMVLSINSIFIAHFFSERLLKGWTQKQYQNLIFESLKEGKNDNLSAAEVKYACYFYQQCTIKGQSDIRF